MIIKNADLEVIATRVSQYPDEKKPEFLLVGRSNVGKSSFINSICGRKKLAYTSSKPGKTQTLNFYNINNSFYLIDAPGYGYAAVDKKTQAKFGMMIEDYLESRKELKRVFLLVDFRHKPTEDDLLMYNYLKHFNIGVTVIATKSDKISGNQKNKNMQKILETLDLVLGDDMIVFSSNSNLGVKEVLEKIENIISEN